MPHHLSIVTRAALGAEFKGSIRLISAAADISALGLTASAFRTEFALVYATAGAFPRAFGKLLGLFASTLGAEFSTVNLTA